MKNELYVENIKKKIVEKDKLKLKYKQKLEMIKQHYGIEFEIYYLKDQIIEKIKFINLEFKNNIKNISMIYDEKVKKFNYLFYDYDNEQAIRNYDERKIIDGLVREKKLKVIIAEIRRLNEEYKKELIEIDEEYCRQKKK